MRTHNPVVISRRDSRRFPLTLPTVRFLLLHEPLVSLSVRQQGEGEHMRAPGGRVCLVLAAAVLSIAAASRRSDAGPPLRRDLSAYLFFGLRSVGLKNMTVTGACNSGVDCAQPNPNSDCGVITHEDPNYADGSQIAGDRARFSTGGGIIFQLFSNKPTGLDNVFINSPPVEPLSPVPILGDVDGDGAPSCSIDSGSCVVDTGDLAAACGFPDPFPACDPSRPVTITALQ